MVHNCGVSSSQGRPTQKTKCSKALLELITEKFEEIIFNQPHSYLQRHPSFSSARSPAGGRRAEERNHYSVTSQNVWQQPSVPGDVHDTEHGPDVVLMETQLKNSSHSASSNTRLLLHLAETLLFSIANIPKRDVKKRWKPASWT